jgi:hypothetical protein
LQRLAQVVTRRGEKPGLRIIRPIRLFAGCDQRVVDGSALRHVANGGRDERLVAVHEGCEANPRREFSAVRPAGE